MFSAVHPRTYIDGFSRACDGQQNVRAYYATLPRPTVWRISKPANWGGSRYSVFLSPARLSAFRNASAGELTKFLRLLSPSEGQVVTPVDHTGVLHFQTYD